MSKKKSCQNTYTPDVRDRAVRMLIQQHSKHNFQWAAIESIAAKIGCSKSTDTQKSGMRLWVRYRGADDKLCYLNCVRVVLAAKLPTKKSPAVLWQMVLERR